MEKDRLEKKIKINKNIMFVFTLLFKMEKNRKIIWYA